MMATVKESLPKLVDVSDAYLAYLTTSLHCLISHILSLIIRCANHTHKHAALKSQQSSREMTESNILIHLHSNNNCRHLNLIIS